MLRKTLFFSVVAYLSCLEPASQTYRADVDRGDLSGNPVNPCAKSSEQACSKICTLKTLGNHVPEYYKDAGAGWDSTKPSGTDPKAPKVRSVGSCRFIRGKEVCLEGEEGLTLVTNEASFTNSPVKLPADNSVTMRFFAFADNNHMPIRRIAIDWGDGQAIGAGDNFDSNIAYYRNQRGGLKGVCAGTAGDKKCKIEDAKNVFYADATGNVLTDQKCVNNADCNITTICSEKHPDSAFFGILKDKTCNVGYHEFRDHNYECIKDPGNDYYKAECPVDKNEFPNGCCVYQPKVHVKDNWGWCTGTEDCDSATTGMGCYDNGKLEDEAYNFCDITSIYDVGKNAWTYYSDNVYVAPEQ